MNISDAQNIRFGGKDAVRVRFRGVDLWVSGSSINLTSPDDGATYSVGDTVPLSVSIQGFDTASVDYIIERVS